MRILQVNKLYHPWIGGVETVAADIAQHLNAVEGVTVTNLVCQPSGNRQYDVVDGIVTYRAASWGMISGMPISLDFFVLFRKLAKDADVVILHHPFPLAAVAYCLFGMRIEAFIWYHSDIVRQKFSKIPFTPFIRTALKKSKVIFVSSRAIIEASDVLRTYRNKCKVIYFGINIAGFASTDHSKAAAEQIRETFGTPIVLAVGRLVYYKGLSYLIRAMKDVSAHLLIIGTGPLKPTLLNEIRELGLDEKATILDPVVDLVPYYHACDVFALPSCETSETYGVVQMEALACGKPVVNTDLPTGVPEISVHGVTGRTVPTKNAEALAKAIRDILSDKDEYQRLSRNALRAAQKRFAKERFGLELKHYLFSVDSD